jgi:folate-binding protein YgfZ
MSEITYSIISVSGADAFDFLQAQLASDITEVARLPADALHRSAWCNPKGRVICTPRVNAVQQGFELTVPADLGELVVQRLTLFRFRAKVDFELRPGPTATEADALTNIQAGVPEIALAQAEKFTPHMLNLDLLRMVSVEKGCYPGQEIVARTHFRGASKRRCLRFGCAAAVQPGARINDGQHDIGEVVNAAGGELLAVVPLSAAAAPLFVEQQALVRLELPYSI